MTDLPSLSLGIIAAGLSLTVGLMTTRRRLHPLTATLIAVTGVTANAILAGLSGALSALLVSAILFLILFFTRIVGATSTLAIPALLTFADFNQWWIYLTLFTVTVIASAWATVRHLGISQLQAVTQETIISIVAVNPESIKDAAEDYRTSKDTGPRINIASCFAVGYCVTVLLSVLIRA